MAFCLVDKVNERLLNLKHSQLFIDTMSEPINEKITVLSVYDRMNGRVMPRKMRWQGRMYRLTKLAYYHKIRQGRTVIHVFHVTDGTMDFRLSCNSENLHWTLEEVSDGSPTQ